MAYFTIPGLAHKVRCYLGHDGLYHAVNFGCTAPDLDLLLAKVTALYNQNEDDDTTASPGEIAYSRSATNGSTLLD